MQIRLKKVLFLLGALSVIGACAANTKVISKSNDKQGVVDHFKVQLLKSTPNLSSETFTYDEKLGDAFKLATNSKYFPMLLGKQIFILDKKGQSLITPNALYLLKDGALLNAQEVINQSLFADNENKVVWPTLKLPKGIDKKADAYVFTDPTCGYCRKVEAESEEYEKNGIQLHYIPYPRTGLDQSKPAFKTWVKALCSKYPARAYHDLVLGKNIDKYKTTPTSKELTACHDQIKKGFNFGRKIGLQGTPYFFVENGTDKKMFVPGYVSVKDIMGYFNFKESIIENKPQ